MKLLKLLAKPDTLGGVIFYLILGAILFSQSDSWPLVRAISLLCIAPLLFWAFRKGWGK
jgi:hypothetical protein